MSNSKLHLLVALLFCLTPYLLLCLYISPSGDDYSYAHTGANSRLFFDALIKEWKYWNGRYISNVFVLCNPITYNHFGLYQAIPILLITLFTGSHTLLVYKSTSTSIKQALIISLCFLLIYLSVMPDVGEGIFWYTAAVTYFAPLTIFPLYLLLILTLKNKTSDGYQPIIVGLLLIFQFLLTGFNEILMILMTLLQLGLVVVTKKKKNIYWLLLVSQLFFSTIVFFAPGNEVRSSFFLDKYDFLHTIINGSKNTLRFTFSLIGTPSLWIGILLILKLKLTLKLSSMNLWLWLGIFMLPQFIACAGPVWTTGIIGQHRTANFALYFQILVIFMFLMVEKSHIITSKLKQLSTYTSLPRLILGLLISLLLFGNGKKACIDLLYGDAKGFYQENLKRAETIKSFTNLSDTTIFLPEYQFKPESIFIYDITTDSKDWKNEAYTTYYGLKQKNIYIKCKP
jgi:hypothetical protein